MKRYRHILSFLLCLAPFTASAQHPTAHWARASSAAELAEGEAVAADISGNVYVTGEFNDSIIAFGNIVLYDSLDFQFFSKYNSAPFLVKYSSTGSVLWANSFSTLSTYDPRCSDVATDQKGYVYWALSTSIGYQLEKAVVLKYDSLGILLWQIETRTDSSFYCSAPKLALDKSGNIYMTGYFGGDSMVLGSHVLRNSVPGAHQSLYIIKLDPTGSVLWAKSFPPYSRGTSWGYDIAVDQNNNICLSGNYTMDSFATGNSVLHSIDSNGGSFIIKLDSLGIPFWTKGFSNYFPCNVSFDPIGNLYLAGSFRDSMTIGSMTFYSTPEPYFSAAFFIAKYNPTGNLVWAKSAIGDWSVASSMVTDKNGTVFISGSFGTSFRVDSTYFIPPVNFNPIDSDDRSFIVSFDPNGNVLCAEAFSCGGDDANDVAIDPSGDLYFAGDFLDTKFVIGTDTLSQPWYGNEAMFVAKFTCPQIHHEGIMLISFNPELSIYPNPTGGISKVEYTLPAECSQAVLVISDVFGKNCQTYTLRGTEQEINTKDLISGLYFCSLIVDGQIIGNRKIVVK